MVRVIVRLAAELSVSPMRPERNPSGATSVRLILTPLCVPRS